MKYEYLSEIVNLSDDDKICIFNSDEETRSPEFLEEHSYRIEETYALDYTLATWLYEHIRGYKDVAPSAINIEYHKFEYGGEEFNQLQMIDKCLEELEIYLKNHYKIDGLIQHLQEALRILTVIIPAMWW